MIQTTSLETSKLLKENGFRQDNCERAWEESPLRVGLTNYPTKLRIQITGNFYFAAPTTDELLEELPEIINQDGEKSVMVIGRVHGIYKIGYRPYGRVVFNFENKSLPEALAAMWLWIKKEGLIK